MEPQRFVQHEPGPPTLFEQATDNDILAITTQSIHSARDSPQQSGNSATLLILAISSVSFEKGNFENYASTIRLAAATATRRLYVYLVHPVLACPPEQRAQNWTKVQRLSTFVYSTCVSASPLSDTVVLFDGWSGTSQLLWEQWKFIFANSRVNAFRVLGSLCEIQIIDEDGAKLPADSYDQSDSDAGGSFEESKTSSAIATVTVNGTFDHLHHGHKNHLALAAWLASETLICSISPDDYSLVERKKYSSVLQNYSIRSAAVERFLRLVKASGQHAGELNIQCVPKFSKLGAQVSEANIQAAVLSTESAYLSPKIAAARNEAGHSDIQFFTVDVVRGTESTANSANAMVGKLSSSNIRRIVSEQSRTFVLINGHAGAGKHSIAMALCSLIPQSRVIDNHLLADLADAICSRHSSNYSLLRGEIRRVMMDHITTNNETGPMTYIFTSNFSDSFLGTEAAVHFQESAARAHARFIPVNMICSREEIMRRVASPMRQRYSRAKLVDPDIAASIVDRKTMFEFDVESKLRIDVSSLTAEEAATEIFAHIEALV
ncbi:hypothetical protein CPB84DRAFT_1708679 [Gymnopilus junonius]|uniref:Cytidyltransferase-like domain-containing protein n=1 Tax=Gymnopilus junonius TaxID=109634 RepID=A0A9P5NL47_GYMJU|nr:hypothetical protein CPB84DRAFT_1708679 [Gymnopilus junonius]